MISTTYKKKIHPVFTTKHFLSRSVIVKNMAEPLNCECNCSDWLDHWGNCANVPVVNCSNRSCKNSAEIGGQVKKMGEDDHARYILPLCEKCNSLDELFEVNGMTCFVPAQETHLCSRERS